MKGGMGAFLTKPEFSAGNAADWVKCGAAPYAACPHFPDENSFMNNYMQVVSLELGGSTGKWLIGSFLAKKGGQGDKVADHMNFGGANEFKGSQSKFHKSCTFDQQLTHGTGDW